MASRGSLAGVAVLVAAAALAPLAAAQSGASGPAGSVEPTAAKDQARALFSVGLEHYRAGRYKDAVDEFLKAHAIFPNPVLSFNAAIAYESMGDSAGALRFYREYLRQAPAAEDSADVAKKVSELESALQSKGVQQVTILSTPPGATVQIDGRPVGVTPFTGEILPGRHRLALHLDGYQVTEREFELFAHRALDVTAELEAEQAAPTSPGVPEAAPPPPRVLPPPPPPAPEDTRAPRLRPLTYATLGLGLATVGAAAVFEVLRQQSENDVRQESTQLARYEAFDQMENRQQAARVLVGIGAAVTLAGGALIVVDLTRDAAPRRAGLYLTTDSFTLRGTF